MTRLEALQRVARLAGAVVLETPERSKWSSTSYVRRSLISELSDALTDAGYDMKAARKLFNQQKRKAKNDGSNLR